MANYNMLSTAKTTITAVSSNLYSTSGIGVTLLLLGFCFAPPGFEPEFEPRLAHYSKCYTYTWFGSALQNTYISSLGLDDASSDSFPTRRSRISA